jgi:hypothetical protein
MKNRGMVWEIQVGKLFVRLSSLSPWKNLFEHEETLASDKHRALLQFFAFAPKTGNRTSDTRPRLEDTTFGNSSIKPVGSQVDWTARSPVVAFFTASLRY